MSAHLSFTASVIPGEGKGKELGIPTLNLETSAVPDTLEEGVYAVFADLGDNAKRPAAMHYGARPTLGYERSCEVHIIDEDITTEITSVSIEVIKKLRGVQKFASAAELIEQLQNDIKKAKDLLT